jgi:hypothetical protein
VAEAGGVFSIAGKENMMSKRLMYLTGVVVAALLLGGVTWAAHDVTGPGDAVQGVPNDGVSTDNSTNGWPGNESPPQAIDDQVTTKYLNFRGEVSSTGFQVTPKVGPTVVTGLSFATANDAPERDPVKYELSGSNTSIDGPYTLIAKGDITDFIGGLWARRTINATPIRFANTVSYKHYQLMFPAVSNPSTANSMQIAEVELLADTLKATVPNPADGSVITMPLFQWTKGDTTLFHDVYLGTSPNLTAADLKSSHQFGAMTIYYYPMPMTAGTTYYWRVDEIDASGTVYTGDVWSVIVAPKKAYNPRPLDGDKWLPVTTQLSWTPGANATQHDVFFGTDKTAVTNRSASVSKGSVIAPTYDPKTLQPNTTYYWAVDETALGVKYAGDVWSFTTVGTGGGARGDYFVYTYAAGTTPSGTPVLSRIDATINFTLLGTTSPGAPVPGDGWAARWTADLEIAVADTYQFSINCQDGTRMWIDGQLIIDRWVVPTVTSEYFAVPMHMDRGIHSLRVEFFDSGGDAVEQLYWSTASMAKVIIPAGPLQPPVRATATYPADKAVGIPQTATLTWGAGEKAAKHNVYFGTDANAVANATPADTAIYQGQQAKDKTTFAPGTLDWSKTYYWRIDEVNDASPDSPWKGGVWSFTTADFLVVDDMESYNDDTNRIYDTWTDGYTDGLSGSTVGNFQAPFAEQTIIHGGKQSMPMDYNNTGKFFYSEAVQTFAPVQDWTVNGVTNLSLWARGYPAVTSVAVSETAPGKMSLTGDGADIWNNSDDFVYAYKTLTGNGSIIARVVSIGPGTNTWAKGGVMIRDSLNGGSTFVDMVITANTDGAAGNGASFQYRPVANAGCSNTDSPTVVAAPYWVKIDRTGDSITGSYSTDGKTWRQVGTSQTIAMTAPVYIGLCVTAHQSGEQRTFQFDSISTTGGVTGQWQGVQINSPQYNGAGNLYVVVEDSAGKTATATNATAVNSATWTNWKIPLSSFTGVSMSKVKKLYIGVGDRKATAAGGSGRIYIDDISVTKQ